MIIHTISTGDIVHRYNKNVIIQFKGKRGVLSTGILNGGYREDLKAVFNHDAKAGAGMGCVLKADSYKEHLELVSKELGLDTKSTSCIGTAADMDNMSIKTEKYKDITVTAMVTGGIERNGGRVGDPASFHEENGEIHTLKPGTINIMVVVDAKLPPSVLTRALVTTTEAKTAAIQELMAGSNYSSGLATGSGTDGTIMVSNLESNKVLSNAGKHSKLGELIGKSVKDAVKEALYLQTGLSPKMQCSLFRRVKRYGITEETVWARYEEVFSKLTQNGKVKEIRKITKLDYFHNIDLIEKDEKLVAVTSLYVHLMDQLQWQLLSPKIVYESGLDILTQMAKVLGVKVDIKKINDLTEKNVIEFMKENLNDLLVKKVCDFIGG